jgi:hypothetical protein
LQQPDEAELQNVCFPPLAVAAADYSGAIFTGAGGGAGETVMRMIHCAAGFGLLLGLAQPALATDLIPGGEEHVRLTFGGILARIDSGIGVDGTASDGSVLDLEGVSGRREIGNVVVGVEWRIAPRHRINGIFFRTSKERTLNFDQSITIDDDTLVPPTTLMSKSKNQFMFATYQYSFVKKKDVELSGLIGAYVNKFSDDLSGTATVTNSSGTSTVNKTVSYRPAVTVPLPLVGASVNWYASPRLTLGASLSGMKAKIGDVDGSVYVATVSAEYMFTRNIGAGVSYMHTDANVDITKKSFVGTIDWKNDNLLGYVLLKF